MRREERVYQKRWIVGRKEQAKQKVRVEKKDFTRKRRMQV